MSIEEYSGEYWGVFGVLAGVWSDKWKAGQWRAARARDHD